MVLFFIMLRPYESDQHLSAFGGLSLEYDRRIVLQPDVVTESLARLAGRFINSHPETDSTTKVLELGTGAAPFLAWVADSTDPHEPLDLTGTDIDPQAMHYARFNVETAIKRRSNPADSVRINQEDWRETLVKERYDYIYFNPPFLPPGEEVREGYRYTPTRSMYVEGGVDGLEYYHKLMPFLRCALNPGGRLFVRTPRGAARAEVVHRIINDVFGDDVTIHQVGVEAELGEREGGGLVVDTNGSSPTSYRYGHIRAIGLGMIEQVSV